MFTVPPPLNVSPVKLLLPLMVSVRPALTSKPPVCVPGAVSCSVPDCTCTRLVLLNARLAPAIFSTPAPADFLNVPALSKVPAPREFVSVPSPCTSNTLPAWFVM